MQGPVSINNPVWIETAARGTRQLKTKPAQAPPQLKGTGLCCHSLRISRDEKRQQSHESTEQRQARGTPHCPFLVPGPFYSRPSNSPDPTALSFFVPLHPLPHPAKPQPANQPTTLTAYQNTPEKNHSSYSKTLLHTLSLPPGRKRRHQGKTPLFVFERMDRVSCVHACMHVKWQANSPKPPLILDKT